MMAKIQCDYCKKYRECSIYKWEEGFFKVKIRIGYLCKKCKKKLK